MRTRLRAGEMTSDLLSIQRKPDGMFQNVFKELFSLCVGAQKDKRHANNAS